MGRARLRADRGNMRSEILRTTVSNAAGTEVVPPQGHYP